MKRLGVLSFFAVLTIGDTSFSDSSTAQQKLGKDQLVGTWALVSCMGPNGGTPPYCVNPNGRMMLEAGGRYTYIIAARNRPKCSGACGRGQMSGEQYKAATQGVSVFFGDWSLNEADQTLTLTSEVSLFPNAEGIDAKGTVSLGGDELRIAYEGGRNDVWRHTK